MATAKPRKKLRKKDLKAPIAAARGVQRLWDFLEHNYKQVLIGVAVFLVVGLTIVMVQSFLAGQRADASADFGRALETRLMPLKTEPGAPDLSKLPRIEGYEPVEMFDTNEARARAALAKFNEVKSSHDGDDVATLAKLGAAGLHFELGEWDQAIALYQEFLAEVDTASPLRSVAQEALGAAFEAKGDLANARTAYEALNPGGATDAPLADKHLYHLGRLAAIEGDEARARELFEQVKAQFPASPLVVDIDTRLTLLNNPDLLPPLVLGAAPTPTPAGPGSAAPGTAAPAAPAAPAPAPASGSATGTAG